MKRLVAALSIVVVLAACTPAATISPSGAPAPTPTAAVATATPAATPSPSPAPATPSTSPAPTPSASPASDLGDFECSYPYARSGNAGRAHISDVRVGTHARSNPPYDRVVFQFERGIPDLDIRVGEPPLTYDPSGLPMDVEGNDFLILILRGGTGITPNGRETYRGPTEFTPNGDVLVEFEQAGDFEAQSEWVAGLTGPSCVRVFRLREPARLVIDFAARP